MVLIFDSFSYADRLGLAGGVLELSLPRRLYDRCVMVELLPLDLSLVLVRPDSTDSRDGLIFSTDSALLGTPPERWRAGRRCIDPVSSRCLGLLELLSLCLLRPDPLTLDSVPSSILLNLGKNLPMSLSDATLDCRETVGLPVPVVDCPPETCVERLDLRLRLTGSSSKSSQSAGSLTAGLGPDNRFLVVGGSLWSFPFAIWWSSAGSDMITRGGTGGDVRPGYEWCHRC